MWEVGVADGVARVTAGEIAVIEIVAVAAVAEESRQRKENLGYAAGQIQVRAEGPNFVLFGGSGGRVRDTLEVVEGEHMDMGL